MKTPLIALILLCFMCTSIIGPMPNARAEELLLPKPGVMVHLSPPMNPAILKGIKVYPQNPLKFDFILDKGDSVQDQEALKQESSKLVKYFLAALTIPDNDLWVNLSPYEKDRIIPQSFGLTEMGRDLLAQDYLLKQITASLIYPEDEIGKKFWKKVYTKASQKYGTTSIPVNTFNKVWIVPEKAVVYENAPAGTAYVVESRLKVMLEQDYLSLQKHEGEKEHKETNQLGSQIIREIVLPELSKEVNENQNFMKLRQVYNSLILATWYKKKIKDSLLGEIYTNQNKIAGIKIEDPKQKEKIYQQYLQAFKKGVYNYIKEESDPITNQVIPRKYFSGGVQFKFAKGLDRAMTIVGEISDKAMEGSSEQVSVDLNPIDAPSNLNQRLQELINKDRTIEYLLKALAHSDSSIRKRAAVDFSSYDDDEKVLLDYTEALMLNIPSPLGMNANDPKLIRQAREATIYALGEMKKKAQELGYSSIGLKIRQILQADLDRRKAQQNMTFEQEIAFINDHNLGHEQVLDILENLRLFMLANPKKALVKDTSLKYWVNTSISWIYPERNKDEIAQVIYSDQAVLSDKKDYSLDITDERMPILKLKGKVLKLIGQGDSNYVFDNEDGTVTRIRKFPGKDLDINNLIKYLGAEELHIFPRILEQSKVVSQDGKFHYLEVIEKVQGDNLEKVFMDKNLSETELVEISKSVLETLKVFTDQKLEFSDEVHLKFSTFVYGTTKNYSTKRTYIVDFDDIQKASTPPSMLELVNNFRNFIDIFANAVPEKKELMNRFKEIFNQQLQGFFKDIVSKLTLLEKNGKAYEFTTIQGRAFQIVFPFKPHTNQSRRIIAQTRGLNGNYYPLGFLDSIQTSLAGVVSTQSVQFVDYQRIFERIKQKALQYQMTYRDVLSGEQYTDDVVQLLFDLFQERDISSNEQITEFFDNAPLIDKTTNENQQIQKNIFEFVGSLLDSQTPVAIYLIGQNLEELTLQMKEAGFAFVNKESDKRIIFKLDRALTTQTKDNAALASQRYFIDDRIKAQYGLSDPVVKLIVAYVTIIDAYKDKNIYSQEVRNAQTRALEILKTKGSVYSIGMPESFNFGEYLRRYIEYQQSIDLPENLNEKKKFSTSAYVWLSKKLSKDPVDDYLQVVYLDAHKSLEQMIRTKELQKQIATIDVSIPVEENKRVDLVSIYMPNEEKLQELTAWSTLHQEIKNYIMEYIPEKERELALKNLDNPQLQKYVVEARKSNILLVFNREIILDSDKFRKYIPALLEAFDSIPKPLLWELNGPVPYQVVKRSDAYGFLNTKDEDAGGGIAVTGFVITKKAASFLESIFHRDPMEIDKKLMREVVAHEILGHHRSLTSRDVYQFKEGKLYKLPGVKELIMPREDWIKVAQINGVRTVTPYTSEIGEAIREQWSMLPEKKIKVEDMPRFPLDLIRLLRILFYNSFDYYKDIRELVAYSATSDDLTKPDKRGGDVRNPFHLLAKTREVLKHSIARVGIPVDIKNDIYVGYLFNPKTALFDEFYLKKLDTAKGVTWVEVQWVDGHWVSKDGQQNVEIQPQEMLKSDENTTQQRVKELKDLEKKIKNNEMPELIMFGDRHSKVEDLRRIKNRVIEFIKTNQDKPQMKLKVIGNGDFFDRGPDGVEVFEILKELKSLQAQHSSQLEVHYLWGNHEKFLVEGVLFDNKERLAKWKRNGGDKTIDQFGDRVNELARFILENFELYFIDEWGMLHVHAGIPMDFQGNPSISMQELQDMQKNLLMMQNLLKKGKALEGDLKDDFKEFFNLRNFNDITDIRMFDWYGKIMNEEQLNPDKAARFFRALGINGIVFGHIHEKVNLGNQFLGIDVGGSAPGFFTMSHIGFEFESHENIFPEKVFSINDFIVLIEREIKALEDQAIVGQGDFQKGGIDLTAGQMNLQVNNGNGSVDFKINPDILENLKNAPGFVPVIIRIEPLNDVKGFLGIKVEQKEMVNA